MLATRRRAREEAEERRQLEEYQRLLESSSIIEQPFLFLSDEVILHIFGFLGVKEVCYTIPSVCKRCALLCEEHNTNQVNRWHRISKDEGLLRSLCLQRWGQLDKTRLFYRDGKVSWLVTLKNNIREELAQKKIEALTEMSEASPCKFCKRKTAIDKSNQRNLQYVTYTECLSCGKCWNWSLVSIG
jgi:hypothetical protein